MNFSDTPNAAAVRASMPLDIQDLVEKYQCPGCMRGPTPSTCSAFEPDAQRAGPTSGRCKGHVPGTRASNVGRLLLGFPNGFNRQGKDFLDLSTTEVVVHTTMPDWFSIFNIPVWAAEYEGDLLIRLYMPRRNETVLLVVKGAKFSDLPKTLGDSKSDVSGDALVTKIEVPLPTINVTAILEEMD